MVTIKDVAERAGVNASTVSRALKNSPTISQKTKDRVRKAMEDMGYVPNMAAKRLASGLTKAIGVIFPPLTIQDRVSQPFFMEILTIINDEAKKEDFTIAIATGSSAQDLADQARLMYKQKLVDGFIVLYSEVEDPVRAYLMAHDIPFILVGKPEELENEISYVDNDNQLMSRTAVDYLSKKGHSSLLFVTDDETSEVFLERYTGYLRGVAKLGLKSHEASLFDRKDPETLDRLIQKIQEEAVTGLVVIDDMISVRLIQFLSYHGLRVPDDISIISFNNSAYAKIIHPYLTTFDVNIKSLGRSSLHRLLEKILNKDAQVEKVVVPFTLMERESVRNLKK